MLRFISLVKPLLLNNKTWTTSFSLIVRTSKLITLRSSERTIYWWEKFWQCIKKWQVFSASREQWVQRILKIMFKFLFSEKAEANTKTWRHVSNSKPDTLLILKVLLAVGRMKSKSAKQNTTYEGAWHIEGSSLFSSLMVKGKKELLQFSVLLKICLILE